MATAVNVQRQPVTSKAFTSAGYDPSTQTLAVEFASGGIHHHTGVPRDVAETFLAHKSLGAAYHTLIKGQYPSEKIDAA